MPEITQLLRSGSCGFTPVQGLSLFALQLVRGIHSEVWLLIDWILEYLPFTESILFMEVNVACIWESFYQEDFLSFLVYIQDQKLAEPIANILVNAEVVRNKQTNNPWHKPTNLISCTKRSKLTLSHFPQMLFSIISQSYHFWKFQI